MGTIRERNGKLEVQVYLGKVGGQRRFATRTIHGTNRAAWKAARAAVVDLEGRAVTHGGRSDLTLAQLLERWQELSQLEASTKYADRGMLDRHVVPALGDVKIGRLRPIDLDSFYRSLERGTRKRKGLAPATVRRLHNRLSSALEQAVKWGMIAENPARRATPPSVASVDPDAPSTDAVRALLGALDGELRTFVWLVAATGLRRAAACALRREDLDLDAGVLRTRRSLGTAKGGPYLKGTKTGARHAMALGAETVTALRDHLAMQNTTAAEFAQVLGPTAFVFSHDDDGARPWRPDYPTHRLRLVRDETDEHGQRVRPELAGITLRGLRHWMITEGLDSGASIKAVAGRASHSRASTTLDVYAAFVPAGDRDLADALESRLTRGD